MALNATEISPAQQIFLINFFLLMHLKAGHEGGRREREGSGEKEREREGGREVERERERWLQR